MHAPTHMHIRYSIVCASIRWPHHVQIWPTLKFCCLHVLGFVTLKTVIDSFPGYLFVFCAWNMNRRAASLKQCGFCPSGQLLITKSILLAEICYANIWSNVHISSKFGITLMCPLIRFEVSRFFSFRTVTNWPSSHRLFFPWKRLPAGFFVG